MKTYTVPLKVFVAYHLEADRFIRFTLPDNQGSFCLELGHTLVPKEGNLVAKIKGEELRFSPDQPVNYPGRYLKTIWDYWKRHGKRIYENWITK